MTDTSSHPGAISSHLGATADAYDAVAEVYAEFTRDALDGLPLDRAVLGAFAECVRDGGNGPVAELGCGPGWVTAQLREWGLDVFGVDVSPVMISLAREAYPELRFEVGSMDALDQGDGTLDGVVSWYSLIHVPPPEVPSYVEEFRRVVAAGGHLLVAFFEAEGGPVTAFDHKVVTAYRWPIDELAEVFGAAGFVEVGRMLREPCEGERFRRGHLLLRGGGQRG